MKLVHAKRLQRLAYDAKLLNEITEDGGDLIQAKFLLEEIIVRAKSMLDELINEGVR